MTTGEPSRASHTITEPFWLGEWRVDPVQKQLSRGDDTVKIDPRNLRVLLLLASRPGQVVSQRDIEQLVWTGSIVTSDSIYQSIAQLRRALGEDKTRRYIETVSRRGYRLVATVTPIVEPPSTVTDAKATAAAPAPDAAVAPARTRRERLPRFASIAAAAFAVLVGCGALLFAGLSSYDREDAVVTSSISPPSEEPRAVFEPATASSLSGGDALPSAYQGASHYRRSIRRLLAGLESQAASVGEDDLTLVPALIALGNYYPLVSEPLECEKVTRRGLAILDAHGQRISPEGVELNATLAEALADTDRFAEAERHLRIALDISRQVHGDAHYATVSALDQLALLRIAEGRYDDAVAEARRAIAAYAKVPERANTRNAYLISTLTWALIEQGHYSEAIREGEQGLAAIRSEDPPAPYLVAYAHHFLAEALLKAGRSAEAEPLLRRELEIFATIPHCEMDTARAQSALAEALQRQGRPQDAEPLLLAATKTLEIGDGWRERKSRRETRERLARLHNASQS